MPNQIERPSPSGSTVKVSIILATNRDSPYLEEALRSVREQTVTQWELLIVDNGIPDGSRVANLIAADKRMRIVKIDDSATAGIARNIGVGLTSAEYVTYLDDDDVWAPDRLEKHLKAHADEPSAPASYSGYWHMDSTGRRFGTDWRSRPSTAPDILRGTADTPLGGTLVVRREDYFAIGGFSPEISILVDFEFALRLALRGDLIYIDEPLLGYRRHAANMTSTAPDNARKRRRAMEHMVERQRWAALGRGDVATSSLLQERLRNYRRNEARTAGVAVMRLLRRGQLSYAAEHSVWALTRSPVLFVGSLAVAPMRKAVRVLNTRMQEGRSARLL